MVGSQRSVVPHPRAFDRRMRALLQGARHPATPPGRRHDMTLVSPVSGAAVQKQHTHPSFLTPSSLLPTHFTTQAHMRTSTHPQLAHSLGKVVCVALCRAGLCTLFGPGPSDNFWCRTDPAASKLDRSGGLEALRCPCMRLPPSLIGRVTRAARTETGRPLACALGERADTWHGRCLC